MQTRTALPALLGKADRTDVRNDVCLGSTFLACGVALTMLAAAVLACLLVASPLQETTAFAPAVVKISRESTKAIALERAQRWQCLALLKSGSIRARGLRRELKCVPEPSRDEWAEQHNSGQKNAQVIHFLNMSESLPCILLPACFSHCVPPCRREAGARSYVHNPSRCRVDAHRNYGCSKFRLGMDGSMGEQG